MEKHRTTEPVQPGHLSGVIPEFGRTGDVQRLFGLKRGTLYNLLRDGKVKGCLLRVRGQKSGVRLFHLDSVRDFIMQNMEGKACEQQTGRSSLPSGTCNGTDR